MSVESLKDKMREFAEGRSDSISLSSGDMSGGGSAGESRAPVSGTVEADVPPAAKDDVFDKSAQTAGMHASLVAGPSYYSSTVDITDEDRAAFLSAIVTGERYERQFSLFGGKLTGTFRCRSVEESDGILAWMSDSVNNRKLDAAVEYLSTIRNAVLAAQVKSLRGIINEDFPELPGPMAPRRSSDGKSVDAPGWLGLAESWGKRPEALVSAVHNALMLFERRYWAMVANSQNQNFWSPAAST